MKGPLGGKAAETDGFWSHSHDSLAEPLKSSRVVQFRDPGHHVVPTSLSLCGSTVTLAAEVAELHVVQ